MANSKITKHEKEEIKDFLQKYNVSEIRRGAKSLDTGKLYTERRMSTIRKSSLALFVTIMTSGHTTTDRYNLYKELINGKNNIVYTGFANYLSYFRKISKNDDFKTILDSRSIISTDLKAYLLNDLFGINIVTKEESDELSTKEEEITNKFKNTMDYLLKKFKYSIESYIGTNDIQFTKYWVNVKGAGDLTRTYNTDAKYKVSESFVMNGTGQTVLRNITLLLINVSHMNGDIIENLNKVKEVFDSNPSLVKIFANKDVFVSREYSSNIKDMEYIEKNFFDVEEDKDEVDVEKTDEVKKLDNEENEDKYSLADYHNALGTLQIIHMVASLDTPLYEKFFIKTMGRDKFIACANLLGITHAKKIGNFATNRDLKVYTLVKYIMEQKKVNNYIFPVIEIFVHDRDKFEGIVGSIKDLTGEQIYRRLMDPNFKVQKELESLSIDSLF